MDKVEQERKSYAFRLRGINGRLRRRMPVALKMALPIGGSYGHDRRFAGAGGGDVFAIEKDGFDLGNVGEARDTIARKASVGDAAVFEFDGFEERTAEALNDSSDDLVAEAIGIYDGAAFESFTRRTILTEPEARSIATSAQVAT